jgi:hypothetical protein
MTQTRKRKNGNPDLRRQQQTPSPSLPQIEEELTKYLQPSLFTQLKYLPGNNDKPMRDRLLNLPVMVALSRLALKIVVMAGQEAKGKSKEVLGDFTFLYTVWFYCVHLLIMGITNRS